jgi:hypothetical protein
MKEITANKFINMPRSELNGEFRIKHISFNGYNYLVANFTDGIYNGKVLSFDFENKPIQGIFYNRGIIEGEFIDIKYES